MGIALFFVNLLVLVMTAWVTDGIDIDSFGAAVGGDDRAVAGQQHPARHPRRRRRPLGARQLAAPPAADPPAEAGSGAFASLGGAMDSSAPLLDALRRPQRWALRLALIKATAVAGNEVTDADRAELTSLVAGAPIEALPEAAAMHRVSGTVLRGLEGIAGVPDAVRTALAARRDQSAMHHLLVVGALSQIGRRFDEAGLSWVAMKGPVVAALLYPAVGERTYNDLDLLVDRRDFPKAMQILEDLGYAHDIHNWALAEEMLAGQVGLATAHDAHRPALAPALLRAGPQAVRVPDRGDDRAQPTSARLRREHPDARSRRHAPHPRLPRRPQRRPPTHVVQGRRALGRRRRTRLRRAGASGPSPTTAAVRSA